MTASEYWTGLIMCMSLGANIGIGLAWWVTSRIERISRKGKENDK